MPMINQSRRESVRLAVALTTMNSLRTMPVVLDSLAGLADRVLVVDSGSTDGTVELCQSRGCEVIHQPWLGHVRQKQLAIDHCQPAEWVLLLDSDESLEPELQQAIQRAVSDPHPAHAGWMINRKLWFLNDWVHYLNFPEWRTRLFRPGQATVAGVDPHDRIDVQGTVGRLDGICRHDSYADLDALFRRILFYSRISARESKRGGSIFHLTISPIAHFAKKYFLERGFLDGRRGLLLAGMGTVATLIKHIYIACGKLIEQSSPPEQESPRTGAAA